MSGSDRNHAQNTMADAAVGGYRVLSTLRKAEGEYCLSVRDGNVFLSLCNPRDGQEDWCKYVRINTSIQDEEGKPAFFLVNKANDLAVLNTFGLSHPMILSPFNPDYLCNSLMWTEAGDVGDGFDHIRALNSIQLNEDHGGVHDGATVVLSEGIHGDFQSWKIVSWGKEGYVTGGSPGRTFRIVCKAGEGFSATVRDGAVVLEPTNHRDECQHWFMDMRHDNHVKDAEGYQAFALVNKFTGKAIKPSSQGGGHPVELMKYKYIPNHTDESVLWTVARDMGGAFGCIRMATNIRLKFNALNGGTPNDKMKQKGKAIEHSQCFGHPISNHYCPSCLQKRVSLLRLH
ncbi:hypothetical protein D1007_04399 [Hordeum vulgare]|nr:hypothetical protein D1007_04399 [Hordeum vulgare]